ncbi:septal ring lytic transglycosylase RlpA family protein [Xanthobacteraceae bacterium Astr-EGSB]|uniref:septal ring lytic transglycosylase RlpA family protein n=1 Tax=Astrobacterium formosum TaxID=3069710 RepID=UPI0027B141AB|nr:septal ring lytic transglycosylase RlpA family protein [Xanthobacteraceae bacterium Astr-EGSB]
MDRARPTRRGRALAFAATAFSLAGCVTPGTPVASAPEKDEPVRLAAAPVRPKPTRSAETAHRFEGLASYYWQGKRVASGARFDPDGLSAAHPSLPFGTRLKVSDPSTGRSVVVTVNDRGPFVRGRVLDLSRGAARALGMESRGVNRVHAQVL